MTHSPFLGPYKPDSIVAWHQGKTISTQKLLTHVRTIRDQLPHKPYVINLCQDRYSFLVGFAAALCRNQTTLLPPNRSPDILQQLLSQYSDCYYLTDGHERIEGVEGLTLDLDINSDQAPMANPQFSNTHIAAIAFTSGTTGTPRPSQKSWGSMVQIAKKTAERLPISAKSPVTVVATVPHQHMYGLETSIMLPLQKGWCVYSERPFFPEDIVSVLHAQCSPRILVSTPIHLRSCVMTESKFPEVACTLADTAPLPQQVAKQVETVFRTTMIESYGFAEAGTIATRRPVQEDSWTLLPELTLVSHTEGYAVSTPYFSNPVPIPDTIQSANPQQFSLEGRPSHLINIGGHRGSLDELNVQLLSIEGVVDGTFYMPEEKEESVTRLIAFVVAPEKTSEAIFAALRHKISRVFLPRPLYLVKALPRNPTGKLMQEDIETLLRTQHDLATTRDRRLVDDG